MKLTGMKKILDKFLSAVRRVVVKILAFLKDLFSVKKVFKILTTKIGTAITTSFGEELKRKNKTK